MVVPRLIVAADRIHGCTPWLMRLLALFAFARCVTVNVRSRHVVVATRRLWFWRQMRIVSFDRIVRIAYRAQALPVLAPCRYLSMEADHSDSALFFISLVLAGEEELPLFTVWERLPREPDWLDRIAGAPQLPPRTGDEAAGRIVALLRESLGVSVRHY